MAPFQVDEPAFLQLGPGEAGVRAHERRVHGRHEEVQLAGVGQELGPLETERLVDRLGHQDFPARVFPGIPWGGILSLPVLNKLECFFPTVFRLV